MRDQSEIIKEKIEVNRANHTRYKKKEAHQSQCCNGRDFIQSLQKCNKEGLLK